MFRRLILIKSGRDGAVYGEKVIILNTFFCSLNNVSSLVVLLHTLQYVTRTEKKVKNVLSDLTKGSPASSFCFFVPRVLSLSLSLFSNSPSPLAALTRLGSHIENLMNLPW